MRAFLMLLLCVGVPAGAASQQFTIGRTTPIFVGPSPESRVLIYLAEGDSVWVDGAPITNGFNRVRVQLAGRWKAGYMAHTDIADIEGRAARRLPIAAGGGFMLTHFMQGSRSFEMDDQVTYKTSSYVSDSVSPFLTGQYARDNFWRVAIALINTNYKGTAITSVGTESAISIKHQMIVAIVEKAYMPLSWKPFYIGAALEVAKALKVSVNFGGNELATSSTELPVYLGALATTGLQFFPKQNLSVGGELRGGAIPNQSPVIYQFDGLAYVYYWF